MEGEEKPLVMERKTLEIEESVMMEKDGGLQKGCMNESKKLWEIAGPVILASVSEFSISFITAAFVGHLGELEFAAVSISQNVIEGFVYGIMLGMGSALETLSGQAVGAGRFEMLGIYLQRSFVVTCTTALCLTPVYIYASPLLQLIRQDKRISELAGQYSLWVIPQLFAYAINFPIQKFLQSQSRVWVMTMISVATLLLHVLLTWIFVAKLNHGIVGAAMAGNISWWLMVCAMSYYVVSGRFPAAWNGFSFMAFRSLCSFVKLSLASAVMFCLELWYYTAVILMVGWLKNPEIAVDAISICMNLQLWFVMIALGFNAAISVRVSNELGAGHPKATKFAIVVAIMTSTTMGSLFTVAIVATKNQFPKMFTDKAAVIRETSKLGFFLAATIFLNSIQPVLYGVAVGAGWQVLVALINVSCYYIFGLPVSALLGYKFNYGVYGIWSGLLLGCFMQTLFLSCLIARTKWQKEALLAEARMKTWGSKPNE
ncbi:hypothetical protein Pint_34567 [Pistacia integerrima]|uniref:Uncharacterized protein n=1 Tax=Pistacia integerrima TaxID=434235 RepID=A0ACC0X615_9ROSI|nr:hypothetical protein Pint_34567 [Pistacia integerrima]